MSLPILDAVTAIFVHDGAVFMTRRHPAMMAFPGYHAFPGGKIDPEDASGPAFTQPMLAPFDTRQMHALVRELREELAYDLPRAIEAGEVIRVERIARALTPTAFPRRFDTWFYRICVRHKPAFEVDTREAVNHGWQTAAAWLDQWRRGELIIAPPTQACLIGLAEDLSQPQIATLSPLADPTAETGDPMSPIQSVFGLRQIFVRSNTLPPAEHTNCFVFGDDGAPRIAIDPSPRDRDELERLDAALRAQGVDRLLITHHHYDHNQFADDLARRHGWPMLMTARTAERIGKRVPRFFDGIDLRLVDEGSVVTQWQGQAVRTLSVPGHDDGQVALMPDGRSWCIVGDLIQGVGTVVISKPEGDMRRYFESLERIIELAPRFIFPSHGIGMGTTLRLEETLKHRRQREAQVRQLHREGRSMQQMLDAIYAGLDPRLAPLAVRNIESHLDKLRADGELG